MSPSTTTTAPSASRPGSAETTRFRCPCGRSVAAPRGSDAAAAGRCSGCRRRQGTDESESLLRV